MILMKTFPGQTGNKNKKTITTFSFAGFFCGFKKKLLCILCILPSVFNDFRDH